MADGPTSKFRLRLQSICMQLLLPCCNLQLKYMFGCCYWIMESKPDFLTFSPIFLLLIFLLFTFLIHQHQKIRNPLPQSFQPHCLSFSLPSIILSMKIAAGIFGDCWHSFGTATGHQPLASFASCYSALNLALSSQSAPYPLFMPHVAVCSSVLFPFLPSVLQLNPAIQE